MLSPELRGFDREAWGSDPLQSLSVDRGADHVAYLGYLNLLLGLERVLAPKTRHAALNDRITSALVRRLERAPLLLLQSYPREVYPVDNCAVAGSIALRDRATGSDHSVLLDRWSRRLRERYLHPETRCSCSGCTRTRALPSTYREDRGRPSVPIPSRWPTRCSRGSCTRP